MMGETIKLGKALVEQTATHPLRWVTARSSRYPAHRPADNFPASPTVRVWSAATQSPLWMEGPGADGERALLHEAHEAVEEFGPIGVTPEDGGPFEPAHHHVVEGVRGIEASLAGHDGERLT